MRQLFSPAVSDIGRLPRRVHPHKLPHSTGLAGRIGRIRRIHQEEVGRLGIRLVLADDHAQFRGYLAGLLGQQPGLEVVAEAEDGEAAIRAVQALPVECAPLLVVMDVEMAGCGGIEATRRLRAVRPDLRVLALTMHDDPAFAVAMLEAGAEGYVLKGDPLAELLQAIHAVAAGQRYVSRSLGGIGSPG